jgi:CheY-like chemotaxis protein
MKSVLESGVLASWVLVVEDDVDLRESIRALLRLGGYTCLTAANGEEALELLRRNGMPCLIVLDLMMPIMDGWSLRRELLADTSLASVPVVLVSGADDVAEEARRLGAIDYLVKPVESRAILDLVAVHC